MLPAFHLASQNFPISSTCIYTSVCANKTAFGQSPERPSLKKTRRHSTVKKLKHWCIQSDATKTHLNGALHHSVFHLQRFPNNPAAVRLLLEKPGRACSMLPNGCSGQHEPETAATFFKLSQMLSQHFFLQSTKIQNKTLLKETKLNQLLFPPLKQLLQCPPETSSHIAVLSCSFEDSFITCLPQLCNIKSLKSTAAQVSQVYSGSISVLEIHIVPTGR